MRIPRLLFFTAVLLSAAMTVCAQKSIDVAEVRRLALYFEIDPGADFSSQQRTLLYESLIARLSVSSDRVALLENRDQTAPASDQERTALAEEIGADAWLQVSVAGSFETAAVRARCLDLLNGITVFELDLDKEIIRGTRELGLLFWNEIEEAVSEYFERALSMENRIGDLTFKTLPGTRIEGITSRRLKASEDGVSTAEVPLPSTLRFRATKPGYWPVEGQLYMDQPEKTVVVEQNQGSRIALDFYLNNFNFPGFDFTYFLIPEIFFVKTGFLTYLLGFVLRGDEERDVFVSFSLNHYNLSLGVYLNAPDRYFRPYLSAGAFWRIVTARGYWGFEPIAPFGMQPILGFEYSRQPRYKFYFEYAPMVHWTGSTGDTFLFVLSIPPDDEFSGYLRVPPWCVINLINFKMGMRVRL